eukprot:4799065-Lingulodinium_polyedra.AAC.1
MRAAQGAEGGSCGPLHAGRWPASGRSLLNLTHAQPDPLMRTVLGEGDRSRLEAGCCCGVHGFARSQWGVDCFTGAREAWGNKTGGAGKKGELAPS